jgi:hypothetical protein
MTTDATRRGGNSIGFALATDVQITTGDLTAIRVAKEESRIRAATDAAVKLATSLNEQLSALQSEVQKFTNNFVDTQVLEMRSTCTDAGSISLPSTIPLLPGMTNNYSLDLPTDSDLRVEHRTFGTWEKRNLTLVLSCPLTYSRRYTRDFRDLTSGVFATDQFCIKAARPVPYPDEYYTFKPKMDDLQKKISEANTEVNNLRRQMAGLSSLERQARASIATAALQGQGEQGMAMLNALLGTESVKPLPPGTTPIEDGSH